MTAKAFNTAAQVSQPYVFDLDREVAAFYRDYPEQKNAIYFIDAATPTGAIYRGEETDEDEVADLLGKNGHLYADVNATYQTGTCWAVPYREEGYSCVILKTPRNRKDVSTLGYFTPSDVADLFSFDHETGHLICPKGVEGAPRMKECVADAYAVIRHFQRFGSDAAAIANLPTMRTAEMLFSGEDNHFTVPVVEKIIADSRKMDFSILTPAETVALAQNYAADNAMDAQFISYVASDFKAVQFRLNDVLQCDFMPLRILGDFVLRTTIPEEFRWGAAVFRALLDGDIGFDGVRLPKPVGQEWTKLRQAIDARASVFSQPQSKLVVVSQPQPKLIVPRL